VGLGRRAKFVVFSPLLLEPRDVYSRFGSVRLHCVKRTSNVVMLCSARCQYMFPSFVVSVRRPFAPSALPDFVATMGSSDFRRSMPLVLAV
jgi:hypothetical protein